jgi:hypothetical protein
MRRIFICVFLCCFWVSAAFACAPSDPHCQQHQTGRHQGGSEGGHSHGGAYRGGFSGSWGGFVGGLVGGVVGGYLGGAYYGGRRAGGAVSRGPGGSGRDWSSALTPVREYLSEEQIPPDGAGAYGMVVFQYKATSANAEKLKMVCNSYIKSFPKNATSRVPLGDRMITVWPVDNPDAEQVKTDDCVFVTDHYDLNASEAAINDAKKQNATFSGEGPYLVGWSPSNTRGIPDKLVLVIDMSDDNDQATIDHQFLFWKNQIVENPSLWRHGFSLEGFRLALQGFANRYGDKMLETIKLVGYK